MGHRLHLPTATKSDRVELPPRLEGDLRLLTSILRRVVKRQHGTEVWELVRELGDLARAHEKGTPDADARLSTRLGSLSNAQLEPLMRVFGHYFDIANIAEDLQRIRVLSQRRSEGTLADSLERCLAELERTIGRNELRSIVASVESEFVFTAHPTEARRQTMRRILARIRCATWELGRARHDPLRRRELLEQLEEELTQLTRTDSLHAHRPEVLEELNRALAVSDSLWRALPSLAEPLAPYGAVAPVRFGCWIGGDRDGHPYVTTQVTRETFERLKQRCIELHRREIHTLYERLSVVSNTEARDCLCEVIARAHGQLGSSLGRIHPDELYRQALHTIELRLPNYASASELLADVQEVIHAAEHDRLSSGILRQLGDWQRRVEAFGLHLMRLDIRENSVGFRRLASDLLVLLGHDPAQETGDDFGDLWTSRDPFPGWGKLEAGLDERSYDLLTALALAHERWSGDPNGVGPCIISMTHRPADVLWVLWILRCLRRWLHVEGGPSITPLFETIDDLQRSAKMLEELFAHPIYQQFLDQCERRQIVMIGYSDSAKDGGYAAACWSLYQGQQAMEQTAAAAAVQLTCFHGRGGALGRGGGPAARAIEALPPTPGQARIRMTEQGEVIADRFVDADLAARHMEQILGGLITHAATASAPEPAWQAFMNQFSAASRQSYLALYQHRGFYHYFRQATPAAHIEKLPIGSRPSRRSGAASLEDLRAIPYTFSWTQSRQLLNAFYGLGTAWQACSEVERDLARDMYREWPFFRSMIDNAELALIKCDARILQAYSELMDDRDAATEIANAIVGELSAATEAVLAITGQESLLANTPWLRQSVERRKPYLDVLNFMQIGLMKRQDEASAKDFTRGLRLSIQALAAGLRSTG